MKKASFLFIILAMIFLILGCSSNGSLSHHIEYSNKISQKVEKLYNEKSEELCANADTLITWRKQMSNIPVSTFSTTEIPIPNDLILFTIERNKEGKWQYYTTDDYMRNPFEWNDKVLEKIISTLFNDYDVSNIIISDDSIHYYISSDILIYSMNNIETGALTEHIQGNWYHFKFPYGI